MKKKTSPGESKKKAKARSEGNATITISCTQELKDRIEAAAVESGRNVSQYIRHFAEELLLHKQREKEERDRLNEIAIAERSKFTENRRNRHA